MKTSMPEKIIFEKENYDSVEDMFKAIAAQLKILTLNGYATVVLADPINKASVIVEFASTKPQLHTVLPIWLTSEEYQVLAEALGENDKLDDDLYDMANLDDGKKGGHFDA